MNAGTKTPASQPTSLAATVDSNNGLKKIEHIRIRLEDALKGKQDVIQQVRQRVVLQIGVTGDLSAAAKLLEQHADVDTIEENAGQLTVTLIPEATDYSELSATLVDAGHRLTLFREEEINLESAFMALTKGTGKKI